MADPFASQTPGLESPASHLLAVTPSDSEDLEIASRGINVAASGTVRVTTIHDDTETVFIAAGSAFPLRVKRIWATGTTATGIVVMC
jgi:hypothetical protein